MLQMYLACTICVLSFFLLPTSVEASFAFDVSPGSIAARPYSEATRRMSPQPRQPLPTLFSGTFRGNNTPHTRLTLFSEILYSESLWRYRGLGNTSFVIFALAISLTIVNFAALRTSWRYWKFQLAVGIISMLAGAASLAGAIFFEIGRILPWYVNAMLSVPFLSFGILLSYRGFHNNVQRQGVQEPSRQQRGSSFLRTILFAF